MKIGDKIAKASKNINLTQDQLAELLEVTRQTISKWESNLAFPEAAKIVKVAEILKVSCDYLLKDNKSVVAEVTKQSADSYAVEWAKLYPVLEEYKSVVDCTQYHIRFTEMIKEMMAAHNYSLDDAILVLKDLMYKAYLQLQEEGKQGDGKSNI